MDEVNFCNGLVKTSVKNVTPIKRQHTTASIVSHVFAGRKNLNFFFITS
jgi:hypothetical protein